MAAIVASWLYYPKLQIKWRYAGEKETGLAKRVSFCALRASVTDDSGVAQIFPRIGIRDPYKRLGVPRDADEEEICGAFNFLLDRYAGHESSVESIEAAYEAIIMASFKQRKKTKFNMMTTLQKKVEESPPWVQRMIGHVELPPSVIILRRLLLFSFLGVWSVMNSAESGPAFQVAISLATCIYFLHAKMKNLKLASITGFVAFVIGWICGSLIVPMIPSVLLHPDWTLELLTSLVSYIFLFVCCTFLK